VYGQSRSAALIISYLVSIGHSIDESMTILKIARPIICINPGFLCQLLLLSLKKFDSPDVKIIIQKSQSLKFKKLDYIDSYKEINLQKKGKGNNEVILNNTPNLCAESLIHKNIPKIEGTNICNKKRSYNNLKNEELQCRACKCILARRQDVITSISYELFLKENTDDYWKGMYTCIRTYIYFY
jgi:hypothetical protein